MLLINRLAQPRCGWDDKLTTRSQGSCSNPGLKAGATLWFKSEKGEKTDASDRNGFVLWLSGQARAWRPRSSVERA